MKNEKKENIIFLSTGLLMLISELWKQCCLTFITGRGFFQWSFIPWQLCSLPMYLCLLIGVCRRQKKLRAACITFLSDFSLMSGIIVFLDTSGMHYEYAPLTFHSYLWHIGIILLGIYAGTRRRDKTFKAFTPAALIYVLGVVIAEIINLSLDKFGIVNMFYINPHYYMNQIVFCDMIKYIGNNAAIVLYILCTILGAAVVHLLWKLVRTGNE